MKTLQPWQMTRKQWDAEREACRANIVQSNFTRASGSQAVARMERLEFLMFGVNDEAKAIVNERADAIKAGRPSIYTTDQAREAYDSLQQWVTHKSVVLHALSLGLPVPPEALEAYPDLSAPEDLSRTCTTAPLPSLSHIVF